MFKASTSEQWLHVTLILDLQVDQNMLWKVRNFGLSYQLPFSVLHLEN